MCHRPYSVELLYLATQQAIYIFPVQLVKEVNQLINPAQVSAQGRIVSKTNQIFYDLLIFRILMLKTSNTYKLNDEYAEKYAEYVCLGDDEDAQKQFALIHEQFL